MSKLVKSTCDRCSQWYELLDRNYEICGTSINCNRYWRQCYKCEKKLCPACRSANLKCQCVVCNDLKCLTDHEYVPKYTSYSCQKCSILKTLIEPEEVCGFPYQSAQTWFYCEVCLVRHCAECAESYHYRCKC